MWPGLFWPELSDLAFGTWPVARKSSKPEPRVCAEAWRPHACPLRDGFDHKHCMNSTWSGTFEWFLWAETQSTGVQSRPQLKDKHRLGPRATRVGWQRQNCMLCPTLGFYVLIRHILVKFSVVLEFKMSAGLFWGEIYMGRWPPKAVAAMGHSLRSPWFVALLPALALRQLIAPSAAGTAAFLGWTGTPTSSLSPLQSSVLF